MVVSFGSVVVNGSERLVQGEGDEGGSSGPEPGWCPLRPAVTGRVRCSEPAVLLLLPPTHCLLQVHFSLAAKQMQSHC